MVPDISHLEHVCNICSRVYLSKAKLASHIHSHDNKLSRAHFSKVFQQQPAGNSCQFYKLVLRSHMKVHGGNVNGRDSYRICHTCNRTCKDGRDRRSYIRSHVTIIDIRKCHGDPSIYPRRGCLQYRIVLIQLRKA